MSNHHGETITRAVLHMKKRAKACFQNLGGGGKKACQLLVICELGADYWSFTCQNCSLWDWRGMSPRTFEGGQSERLNFFDQGGGVILGL